MKISVVTDLGIGGYGKMATASASASNTPNLASTEGRATVASVDTVITELDTVEASVEVDMVETAVADGGVFGMPDSKMR